MGFSLKKRKERLKARVTDYEKNLGNTTTGRSGGYTKPGSMKK